MLAGEHSGDKIGAKLINQLKEYSNLEIVGVGGPAMEKAGLKSIIPFDELQVMGLVEPLLKLRRLLKLRKKISDFFIENEIDYFFGIDFPDFNMGIYKNLRSAKIKNVQFVSPSVWAWRKSRIKDIRKNIDLVACLFGFESRFFDENRIPNVHMGHPLVSTQSIGEANIPEYSELSSSKKDNLIALVPGSRISEIKQMMPTYINFMKDFYAEHSKATFVIPAASKKIKTMIVAMIGNHKLPVSVRLGKMKESLLSSKVSVVTSGTATLESVLYGAWPVICYKTNFFNYQILSRMITVDHIGLPNLMRNKRVFPELIQKDCNPSNISGAVSSLLENHSNYERYYGEILSSMYGMGLQRTFQEIFGYDIEQLSDGTIIPF